MKYLCYICFLLSGVFSPLVATAQILHLREFPRTQRDTVDIAPGGLSIVDINSQIEIRPDPVAIREAGQAQFPQYFREDILKDKTTRIQDALSNQDRILDLTKQLMTGLDVQKELLPEVEAYLRRVAADSLLSDDFNRYTGEYFQQFKGVDRGQRPDRFVYSIERFNEQLADMTTELSVMQRTSQIQFSIAAWKRDPSGGARVHVENFDRFENGEFFAMPRFVTTLSETDRQQLDNFRQLADGLNEDAGQVLQAYKQKLLEAWPSVDCVQSIPVEMDSAIRSVPADLRKTLQQFTSGETGSVVSVFTALSAELRTWPVTEQPGWKDRLNNTLGRLKSISDTLQRIAGDSILQGNLHLMNVRGCLHQTLTDLQRIQDLVQKFPYTYLHKLRLNSQELAEEILAFNLDAIPPVGLIDLEYTGQRSVGDELLIKAVFRLPDDTTANKSTGHKIEARRLKMLLIGAHSTSKVGLIMANPYTLDAGPDAPEFRFAPSAALLLKFGSRKSHFYNNFLDFGVGLNTAAPDFDLDGKPEFAAGLTGTILRDIISLGWNWNFTLDKPNYFIGIHLPFNLPGVPVNTIQSNPLPE
ncbi:MAG: hypothetical protein EP344_11975 [Bacteroidetes bacterium]|nr:MAG: hypothetical protein EP344_11975 [Bacteroidota bacterium]